MARDERKLTDDEVAAIVASVALTPIATLVTDNRQHDNPIIAVNSAFCSLTGYDRDQILGRNCRFLAGPATEPEATAELRSAIAEGRPTMVELTNYRRNGSAFRNAVMLAPVRDLEGSVALFIGSQMDVGTGSPGSGSRQAKARSMIGGLTRRQRQVLDLMVAGYRNKQIGGALGIDEKTVKMHRSRLLVALAVPTTADAIRIAVEAQAPTADRA